MHGLLAERGMPVTDGRLPLVEVKQSSVTARIVPPERVRYLAEIAETVRGYHAETERLADAVSRVQRLELVAAELDGELAPLASRLEQARSPSR